MRPRFPLIGRWKTKYTTGYNLSSYEYLSNSGDKFILNMSLIDQIFDDMIIYEIVVKIILPKGSHKLNFDLPYEVKQLPALLLPVLSISIYTATRI